VDEVFSCGQWTAVHDQVNLRWVHAASREQCSWPLATKLVKLSAEGDSLAYAGSKRSLVWCDCMPGTKLGKMRQKVMDADLVAFVPTSGFVAAVLDNGTVCFWRKDACIEELNTEKTGLDSPGALCSRPDGSVVIVDKAAYCVCATEPRLQVVAQGSLETENDPVQQIWWSDGLVVRTSTSVRAYDRDFSLRGNVRVQGPCCLLKGATIAELDSTDVVIHDILLQTQIRIAHGVAAAACIALAPGSKVVVGGRGLHSVPLPTATDLLASIGSKDAQSAPPLEADSSSWPSVSSDEAKLLAPLIAYGKRPADALRVEASDLITKKRKKVEAACQRCLRRAPDQALVECLIEFDLVKAAQAAFDGALVAADGVRLLAWEPGLLYDALAVADEDSRLPEPRPSAELAKELLDEQDCRRMQQLIEDERNEAQKAEADVSRAKTWECCPQELAAALAKLPALIARELLTRLCELLEAHASTSPAELAQLRVPPLRRCVGFLNSFLDGRRVDIALSLQRNDEEMQALVKRLDTAQAQLASNMRQVETLHGLLHALSLPSAPPDERLVDAYRFQV